MAFPLPIVRSQVISADIDECSCPTVLGQLLNERFGLLDKTL